MGPNANTSNNSKIQSFLESLRASRANQSAPGTNLENKGPNPFKEFQAKKETEQRRIELFRQAQNNEQVRVYSAKERQREQRISELISKLKSFAKSVNKLEKNLQNAVEVPIIDSSVYQESFIEHLFRQIDLFQKSVNDTNTALSIFNYRSSKMRTYQSLAKTKGSAYTQNNEITVARSVG